MQAPVPRAFAAKIMPKYRITARETWESLVDYEIEASSEEEALGEIETGTASYRDYEHLDREVKKIIDVSAVDDRQHTLPGLDQEQFRDHLLYR